MAALNEYGRLLRVAARHPRDAFRDRERIARQWRALGYVGPPDFDRAVVEYDRFIALIEDTGARVDLLPGDDRLSLDSIYLRDAALVTASGLVLCQMGKAARAAEPSAAAEALAGLGLRVRGAVEGQGRLEGGDVVWLDARHCAVGRGYRSNEEGVRQLRSLLGEAVETIAVPLPHYRGPEDVFHLMSIISPLDRDLAVVYSPLMPVPFRERLLAHGLRLVEVPDDEFEKMGCNVLALAPRRCLMLEGLPRTRRRLEAAGCDVLTYEGREISTMGAGGPTCLTRPLVRA